LKIKNAEVPTLFPTHFGYIRVSGGKSRETMNIVIFNFYRYLGKIGRVKVKTGKCNLSASGAESRWFESSRAYHVISMV